MIPNITFQYEAADIKALIDAETSRHAAFLRYQDGGSAYDDLKVHTNDVPTIEGYVSDAFRTVLSHFDGEGRYGIKDGKHVVELYLPDFDTALLGSSEDEMRRYVVISSTARWLMNRSFGEYAKMVAIDADSSLNRLVGFLRTRTFPFD